MGIISAEIFSILVFMAIITTSAVPLFLKWGSEWLKGRGELVRSADERQGTVIIGAGATARALAKALAGTQPVWLIDKNWQRCQQAKEEGLSVVYGNALDVEVLSQAHTPEAQAFLALTPNEEVNVLAAQLARETFMVPKVRVLLVQGDQSLHSLMDMTAIRPLPSAWHNIKEWDEWLSHRETTQTKIEVKESAEVEQFVMDNLTEERMLPLVVARNGSLVPFATVDELDRGDQVVALTYSELEPQRFKQL